MDILQQDYTPPQLQKELTQADILGTVAIQARQKVEETRWLLSLAQQHSFIKAIVGWIDLQSEKIEEHLIEFTGEPKFAGVRHVIQDEKDADFMLKKEFMRGIAYLQDYGLTYDLLIYPKHLKSACQLVQKFPDLKFVVDHIAKPNIKDKSMEPWAADIKQLAMYDNVYCKLSGLVTEADWGAWKQSDFTPYLDIVMEAFGPDRLMFGSDWPVCLVAGDYRSVVQLIRDYTKQCSESEQAKIMGETCISYYSLNPG
jgi:L-fuconolactonase